MNGEERRRSSRRTGVGSHGIVAARVRPGHAASVIDISAEGVLLETAHRLLPGTDIEVQLETSSSRMSVRGRVLRCSVSALQPCVRYRGAIGFDRALP
ncbi:MAG: PilZ domain-containing protein [Acidobacteria bacterium]|nr:PilZ domain-containing protein [Acidobacteriota bacterium]